MSDGGRELRIIKRRLDELEAIVKAGITKETSLQLASQVPNIITQDISALVRSDYDRIEEAIANLSIHDPDMPKKKQKLIELKQDVPNNVRLTEADKINIIARINEIVHES